MPSLSRCGSGWACATGLRPCARFRGDQRVAFHRGDGRQRFFDGRAPTPVPEYDEISAWWCRPADGREGVSARDRVQTLMVIDAVVQPAQTGQAVELKY